MRPMLRRVCSALLLSCLLAAPARADGLADRADAILARLAPPGGQVGVSVVDLHSGEVLYSHQANDLFTPASTLKLLTSCAALSELGLEYRLTTRVRTNSVVSGGVLHGHLYLQGDGDPTLEAKDLDAMAASLARQGIHEIAGDLIADASIFANEGAGGPGWSCDDLPWGYAAPACGLSLHENEIDLAVTPGPRAGAPLHVALTPQTDFVKLACQAKTQPTDGDGVLDVRNLHGLAPAGPISWALLGGLPQGSGTQVLNCAVADPAHFTATVFAEALARHGVRLDGHVRLGATPAATRTLAEHASAPLAEIVREMDKNSDNLLAETLLRQLGVHAAGAPGTRAKGLKAVQAFLKRAGWNPDAYRMVDGCGLSRYDALTPAELTQLLAYMPSEKLAYPALLIALPVAGVDGTLEDRLQAPLTRGQLRAKTGTMTGVSSLAGYLDTADGRTLAIAVMDDDYLDAPERARALQDALVTLFAGGNPQ